MGFNFPNTPTPGDIFLAPGGPRYVFSEGVWRVVSDAQSILTADTYNRIVNGAMQHSQQNAGLSSQANGHYGADQWLTNFAGAGVLETDRKPIYPPFGVRQMRYRVAVTTGDASLTGADNAFISQAVEGLRVSDFGWGYAGARQVVLRFGWKSLAGTYSFVFRNAAGDRSYVGNFTISAAQADTDTVQTFVIPGDTTGVWPIDNTVGFYLRFVIATGPTYIGVAGWQAGNILGTSANTNGLVVNNNYELYDVGLYLDPLATGVAPRWEPPDYAEELRACQRYYHKIGPTVSGVPYGAAHTPTAVLGRAHIPYGVAMRTTPSVTVSAAADFSISCQNTITASALSGAPAGPEMVTLEFTIAGATVGQGGYCRAATANAAVYLNARM
jgi:hypothetical protein